MHGAVIEPGRHCPVKAVHEPHQVIFSRSFDVLGFKGHAIFQKRFFRANVGDAIDFHTGIAALAIQTVKSPGPMVFEAPGKNPNPVGIQSSRNRIAGNPLIAAAMVMKRQLMIGIDPQRRQLAEPVH